MAVKPYRYQQVTDKTQARQNLETAKLFGERQQEIFPGAQWVVVSRTQASGGSPYHRVTPAPGTTVGPTATSVTSLVPVAGGPNLIPHSLGRPIQGRLMVWQSAAAIFYDIDPSSPVWATIYGSPDPKKWFAMNSSAAINVRIVVF